MEPRRASRVCDAARGWARPATAPSMIDPAANDLHPSRVHLREPVLIPNTAAAILVLILAILPGWPADQVYRAFAGVSWREKQFHHTLRLVGFSVFGWALYSVVAAALELPPATHVFPATFSSGILTAADLGSLGLSYIAHCAGAGIVAAGAAYSRRLLAKASRSAGNRDAWDQFVNFCVNERWVVVRLRSGGVIGGRLVHADVSVEPEFRDIILQEPAELNAEDRIYRTSTQQSLFIRGAEVASIATVYEPNLDKRLVEPGKDLFNAGTSARVQG